MLVVHSENAGLPSGAGCDLTIGRVFAHLNHRGDERAAAQDLIKAAAGDPSASAAAGRLPAPVLAAIRDQCQVTAWTEPRRAPATSHRYVFVAVRNELNRVLSCTASIDTQAYRSAVALGRFVGAGLLSRGEVHEALTAAAVAAGGQTHDPRIQKAIVAGLDFGSTNPRTTPMPQGATR